MPLVYLSLAFLALPFQAYNQDSDLATKHIPIHLLENANSVVRSENLICNIKDIDKMEMISSRTVTVLNRKGRSAGKISIYYNEEGDKIKDIKIEIYDSHGDLIQKIKKKEISDNSVFDGFSIANDARVKSYKHISNDYPYTIKYSYRHESKNSLVLPNWYPIKRYAQSVESSSYKITNSTTDNKIIAKAYNTEGYNVDIDEKNYIFQATGMEALKYEKMAPHFKSVYPYVRAIPSKFEYFGFAGEFSDWKTYGKWMYDNMLNNRGQLPGHLISEIDQLIPENATDETKARIIYDYVTNSTRYVSVQLGIGGFMPFKCSDVYDLKYGDCKALSFYTQNLLEHYGVNAIYTEICSDSDFNIDYDNNLPGPGQGNHIVLCLPNEKDTTWLECTTNGVLYDYTHNSINDRQALLIKESGGELIRTKRYTPEENVFKLNANISVKGDEGLTIEMENEYHNYRYEKYISMLRETDKKRNDRLLEDFYNKISSLKIEDYSIELDSANIVCLEKAKFSTTSFVEKAGDYLIIPMNISNLKNGSILQTDRRQDLYIKDNMSNEIEIEINLPNGYNAIIKESENSTFENQFGEVSSKMREEGGIVIFTIESKMYKGTYDAQEVEEYNALIKELNKALDSKLVLKKIK